MERKKHLFFFGKERMMFGRFAKKVGEQALQGASQGIGMSIGTQLESIADSIENMVSGEDLARVEKKVDRILELLQDAK